MCVCVVRRGGGGRSFFSEGGGGWRGFSDRGFFVIGGRGGGSEFSVTDGRWGMGFSVTKGGRMSMTGEGGGAFFRGRGGGRGFE